MEYKLGLRGGDKVADAFSKFVNSVDFTEEQKLLFKDLVVAMMMHANYSACDNATAFHNEKLI